MNLILTLILILASLVNTSVAGDCPRGWTFYEESCYLYIDDSYTWFEAKVTCDTLKGFLVEITSDEENTFIMNTAKGHQASGVWLGLEDMGIENEFVWSNSLQRPVYKNWIQGEPNNQGGHQDCAVMRASSGTWDDAECDSRYTFFCERESGSGLVG